MCGLIGGFPFAMLNEQMLKDGFAYLLTIPPNVKHVNRLRNN
jgi:hypothetical protein